MEFDATFWATIALFVFIGGMVYMGIPKKLTDALDDKSKAIADDLDKARALREEAQALLAEYEQKRLSAESEAANIIEAAKEDAQRITEEAKAGLSELIERRTKSVGDKITQAESKALSEVRSRSADVAIEAAQELLAAQVKASGDELIDKAIKDVSSRLN